MQMQDLQSQRKPAYLREFRINPRNDRLQRGGFNIIRVLDQIERREDNSPKARVAV